MSHTYVAVNEKLIGKTCYGKMLLLRKKLLEKAALE
jgi:hypothetical protein